MTFNDIQTKNIFKTTWDEIKNNKSFQNRKKSVILHWLLVYLFKPYKLRAF